MCTFVPHIADLEQELENAQLRGPRTSGFHSRLALLCTTLEYLISPRMQSIVYLQVTRKETGTGTGENETLLTLLFN